MSDSYVEYMNIYKPDVFASLADKITDEVPSLKRIKKSVDRTLNWLDNALSNVKVFEYVCFLRSFSWVKR
jgi:queuine tRNA-ribosyltransferase subunit QTRTD1